MFLANRTFFWAQPGRSIRFNDRHIFDFPRIKFSVRKVIPLPQEKMQTLRPRKKRITTVVTGTMVFLWLASAGPVMAETLAVGRFSTEGFTGWEKKIFKGETEYSLIQENDSIVVKAASQATASGLIKKISFDPQKYRYLHWSWRIDKTIAGGDETTKAGDDYAARIYVVFAGTFFWQTKAINYIWANHLEKGTFIANAYSSNAMMVAVESGPEKSGQWLNEKRDIYADFKMLFGSEPGEASAVAIMTDTDDTGGNAIAWYGDITLSTD
jgi:hypothetical protein